MSLRSFVNGAWYLQSVKRLIKPLWVMINGRTGEEKWLSIMQQYCDQQVSIIFDIGASDGWFLRKSAEFFPRAQYHHFEPRPGAAARLIKLAAKLGTMSKVHETALANESGLAGFAVMDYGDASSLLLSTKGVSTRITGQIEVPVERLDSFVSRTGIQSIELLKIDVEGVENRVLLGAQATLKDHVVSVFLEISPSRHVGGASETLAVFEIMFSSGFMLLDTQENNYFFTKDRGLLCALQYPIDQL